MEEVGTYGKHNRQEDSHKALVGTPERKTHLEEIGIDGRIRQDISFICKIAVSPRTRVPNLWHAERSPWHVATTAVRICFIPFDRPVSLYC